MPHYLLYPGAVPAELMTQISAAKIPFKAAESTLDWLTFLRDNEHGVSQISATDLLPVEKFQSLLPVVPTVVSNVPEMAADMAFLSRASIFPQIAYSELAQHIAKSGRTIYTPPTPVGARPSPTLAALDNDMEMIDADDAGAAAGNPAAGAG